MFLVLRLAWADLRHDAILSLCVLLALTAVLAPLLLLFGLKQGTIATLRQRLLDDPRNREIRPAGGGGNFSDQFFREMRQRPDITFLTPTTRQIAATVLITHIDDPGRPPLETDLQPTGPGDDLLLQNGAPIPANGQCVLSQTAAAALHAKPGDKIRVTVNRNRDNHPETATADLLVAGTAAPRATTLQTAFVPLQFLENIEDYKDGQAVPAQRWPGAAPEAQPVWDGALVILPGPLPADARPRLVVNTGFSEIQQTGDLCRLTTATGPIDAAAFRQLQRVLKEIYPQKSAAIQAAPFIQPIKATWHETGAPPGDPGQPVEITSQGAIETPADTPDSSAPGGLLHLRTPHSDLLVPVPAQPASGQIALPASLAGQLRLAEEQEITYDPATSKFLLARRVHSGFRLVAKRLEDVETLKTHLEKQGAPVLTQADRIRDAQELARTLTHLFWLVASVGIAGSMAALIASLYAAAERKRKEMALLRLIGLPRAALARFPVWQALLLATASLLLAAAFYQTVAASINTYFARYLFPGEQICQLAADSWLKITTLALLLALLAALLAALRLATIEPAESLREE